MKTTPKFNSPEERAFYMEGLARVRMRKTLAAVVAENKSDTKKRRMDRHFAAAADGGKRQLSRRRTYHFFSSLSGSRSALQAA